MTLNEAEHSVVRGCDFWSFTTFPFHYCFLVEIVSALQSGRDCLWMPIHNTLLNESRFCMCSRWIGRPFPAPFHGSIWFFSFHPFPSHCALELHISIESLGFPDHDVHTMCVVVALEVDLFPQLKAHLPVDDKVDVMRTFEIAGQSIPVGLFNSQLWRTRSQDVLTCSST